MNRTKLLFLFLVTILPSLSVFSQKKLKTADQLAKTTIYKSIVEAGLSKKRVYILNLDNQKLNVVPEDIAKFKNLQELYPRNNNIAFLPDWLFELKS